MPEQRIRIANRRKINFRSENKKILIICEDSVSAKLYFEDMVKSLKLVKNVDVSHKVTCPKRIVEIAKKEIKENIYEKIYCLFDKDNHERLQK